MATLMNDQCQLWTEVAYAWSGVDIGVGFDYRTAQGFTPSVSGTLVGVSLAVGKSGAPGNLTVGIYATDGLGKPTGSPLTTKVINQASVTAIAGSNVPKLDVAFSSPASLTAGIVYAIALSAASCPGGSLYRWRATQKVLYSGGVASMSSDSGSTWTVASPAADCAFVTTMSVAVATPGLDQYIFGYPANSPSEYQVNLAGAYRAQTFTPSVSAQLKIVRLHVARVDGQTGGTVTVAIQGIDGSNKPDGTNLASQVIADTAIPVSTGSGLLDVTFTTPASLTSGITYAIVLQFNNVDATHRYNVAHSYTANQYANGQRWDSANSGSTWASNANALDLLFGSFMLEPTTTTQTINADAVIFITESKTVQSDTFCGQETVKTIASDSKIIIISEQTIDSDSFCGEETSRTILGNASIGTSVVESIDSEAFCGEEATKVVDADAVILATTLQTIYSNLSVFFVTEQTIQAATIIAGVTYKSISAQAAIAHVVTKTIDSSAVIIVSEPILKLYVVT